ncbi:MAG: fatty acid desaturase [Alphaproteobacteria bacterium]|jgi:fatty acid desaturase
MTSATPTGPATVPPPTHLQRETLRRKLAEAGCFEPTPAAHAAYIATILALGAGGYACLLFEPEWPLRALLLTVVAGAGVQAGFIAHEVSHGAVTRQPRRARWLQYLLFTVVSGVSGSYFRHIHRIHHRHLNEPDGSANRHPPTLSLQRGSALDRAIRSARLGRILLLVCGKTVAYRLDSLGYVLRRRSLPPGEWVALALHAIVSFVLPSVAIGVGDAVANYLLIALIAGPYVGTVLMLSHVGMATFGPASRLPFVTRQVLATRNLGDSLLLSLLAGGANHHIEHHLFPTISVFRLRRARRITRDFCRTHGLPYRVSSLTSAIRSVVARVRTPPTTLPAS